MEINKRIQSVVPSATLALTSKAKALKAQGHDVINFAAGEPDFNTPDFINQAAIKAIQEGFTKYTPSIGFLALREAIVRKFKEDNNLRYEVSHIAVSCGAKHSLFNVIQVIVNEGDEVIVPSPFWVSYPEMIKIAGGVPRIIETGDAQQFKLTAEQLRAQITEKTKALILNSPSNPTGMVYEKEELEAIAEVCVQEDILVISDEIYEKLNFTDSPYVSIGSLNQDIFQRTITVNGTSKAYAMTGWRIGFIGASQDIVKNVKNIQDHSTSNPCSISQKAALEALEHGHKRVEEMRDQFRQRRDLILKELDQIERIRYIKPQGAFYVFCDISRLGEDSFQVVNGILDEEKVAMIPGDGFGAKGYARLSYATSQEHIIEGVRRIKRWIDRGDS